MFVPYLLSQADIKTLSIDDAEITMRTAHHFFHTESLSDYASDSPVMHFHFTYELLFPLSGSLSVCISEAPFRLSRGKLLLVRSGTAHCAIAEKDGTRYGVLQFFLNRRDGAENCGFYDRLSGALSANDHALVELSEAQLAELAEIDRMENGEEKNSRIGVCLLSLVLRLAASLAPPPPSPKPPVPLDNSFVIYCLAETFVNWSLRHPASLSDFTSVMHISAKQAGRILVKLYGAPYKSVILSLRMKNAAFFLRRGELSIYEIAAQCGYSSLNHFYSSFKKYYGCTPKEYRDTKSV